MRHVGGAAGRQEGAIGGGALGGAAVGLYVVGADLPQEHGGVARVLVLRNTRAQRQSAVLDDGRRRHMILLVDKYTHGAKPTPAF